MLRGVLFDRGGVVLGWALRAVARYERMHDIPEHFVNRVVMDGAPHGAWSRLERGELAMDEFFERFERECMAAGHRVDARAMFEMMAAESEPRPAMLAAIGRIRERGLRVGALTNNWASPAGGAGTSGPGLDALRGTFDAFVESAVEGLRKPDPRIYELACGRLGVAPPESAFLDDIGANLKPA